jgi:tetratricopeptide (TPR) repeat protein
MRTERSIKLINETDGLASDLWSNHKYFEAEQSYKRVLDLKIILYGNEHPELIETLENVARMLLEQDRLSEAESYLLRSLSLREKIYGDVHPETSRGLYMVGSCFHAQGKYIDAENYYQKSIKAWGESTCEVGINIRHIYDLYIKLLQDMERLDEAKILIERVKK